MGFKMEFSDFESVIDLESKWFEENYKLHIGDSVRGAEFFKNITSGLRMYIDNDLQQLTIVSLANHQRTQSDSCDRLDNELSSVKAEIDAMSYQLSEMSMSLSNLEKVNDIVNSNEIASMRRRIDVIATRGYRAIQISEGLMVRVPN